MKLEIGIGDAISRIRFAPHSNNLLISSWDSVSFHFPFPLFSLGAAALTQFLQNLRLYDVDASVLRLEASSEAALLDCCFQHDSTAASDGFNDNM